MDDTLLCAAARLVISLPLVAVLAYWAIKFGLGRRAAGLQKRRHMRVVEQMPLGPKISLSLVQVGDKYYLLAHQDGSTVLITQMNEMPAEIHNEQSSVPAGIMPLLVQKWMQRENNGHEK